MIQQNHRCQTTSQNMNRCFQNQAKCNFCFEWFSPFVEASPLNICEGCLDKGIRTHAFKLPSPTNHHYYQLLFINHKIYPPLAITSQLLEAFDSYYSNSISKLIEEWNHITTIVEQHYNIQPHTSTHLQQLIAQKTTIDDAKAKQFMNRIKSGMKFQTNMPILKGVKMVGSMIGQLHEMNQNLQVSFKGYISPLKINRKHHNSSCDKENNIIKDTSKKNITFHQENHCVEEFNIDAFQKRHNIKKLLIFNQHKNNSRNPYHQYNQLRNKIAKYLIGKSPIKPVLHKIIVERILQALNQTSCLNGCIEVVAHKLDDLDFRCYLDMLQWNKVITLKLIKVGLKDDNFLVLLDFIKQKTIETLSVTSNFLTEASINSLLSNHVNSLKNLYIGNNLIYQPKVKNQIKDLKEKFNIYL